MQFLKNLFGKSGEPPRVDLNRRFELLSRVGQGTMSRFFKARDTRTGRVVGLKILDPEKLQKYEARFPPQFKKPTEGEIACSLQHPQVIRTFEWGYSTAGEQFLVMEFLDAVGLTFLIDVQNDFFQQHRLALIIQLGEGLAYLHSQKFIYRDLCPSNVLVTQPGGELKLIDFGLAVPNTPPFQAPGNRTGKANYMAPELARRQKTDQRIDLFSYAVTCFEMFTRRHPWPEAKSLESVVQHMNSPPASLTNLCPTIDPRVAAIIMRGLAREPHERWPSAETMVAEFRATLPNQA